jgi:hypothetical protein
MICAVWSDNQETKKSIQLILEKRDQEYSEISSMHDIMDNKEIILFVDEDLLSSNFFFTNKLICERIENGQWQFIILGFKKKFKPLPYMVKRTYQSIKNSDEIEKSVSLLKKSILKPKSRDYTFAKKMNRLFYIYHCLYEKESISFEEVQSFSKISRRTFQRDLQTLREVLVTQKITLDESTNCYVMDYIK